MSDGVPSEASSRGPDEGSSAQPQTIAQYRLDTVVASGGFGTVVRATDTTLDRTVAIKLIDDPNRAANLITEAKNTSRLSHPRIARVYQAGIDDATGLAFIAFEWVDATDSTAAWSTDVRENALLWPGRRRCGCCCS